jgi:hypothetical protein
MFDASAMNCRPAIVHASLIGLAAEALSDDLDRIAPSRSVGSALGTVISS